MKTIKELADICGVSKVAITKWLEKNGYTERLEKVGNKFVMDDTVADEVIRAYTARREKKKAEPINTASTAEKPLTEDITALLDILRKQLEQKDAEINRLYQQVENLQAINADMVKAVRELNTIQAMQLAEPEKPEEPIKEAEKREDLTEEPRKKSFWDWFRR